MNTLTFADNGAGSPRYRLTHLDALRGIAAMLVVVAHFIERTPLKDTFFLTWVNLGQVGVVIFFLLSGMVIPYSLKEGRHALATFAVSRFFRLYPAYWFSIALAVASLDWFLSTPVSLSTVLINMTMFQAVLKTPDLFGVYWTLIIEMFFYVACAALFSVGLLGKAWVRFGVAIGLLAVALIFAVGRFYLAKKIPVALPLCLSIMFFGSLWRDVSLGVADSHVRRLVAVWLALFVVLLVPICLLAYTTDHGHKENPFTYLISYLIGMASALVVTLYLRRTLKSLTFLGTISYSVYLIHPFFLEWAAYATDMRAQFNVGVFLSYLVATLVLASFSYALLERPSIGMARAINARLQGSFRQRAQA
ncbi:acyltransferase [Pseudomonas monsensis]|uniref:Acyltransferase n=1 Tax=Pseudomonas monsensis TaxID=2745509 RepID=A0ABT3YSX9_9PSED|nr:acyltransferase [Pseudomonas monsensis]MCY0108618.1 acyltransferase [Pseudomonas monsensis]